MNARVSTHRDRLLREGMRQLYARGFHGTTVDGVLEATGVPKGSFYHHFGSKELFAGELLRRYTADQMAMLDRWSETPELTTSQALAGYFRELADLVVNSQYRRACLVGKLTTELAAAYDTFNEQLHSDLDTWRDRIRRLFERGQQRGDIRADQSAEELAEVALALIQGAFVVALATRNSAALDSVTTALAALGTR